MTDLDPTRLASVPRELMERVCRELLTHHSLAPVADDRMLMESLQELRSFLTPPPRRTRAERDREVVESLLCVPLPDLRAHGFGDVVRLLAEPVRDDDPAQDERLLDVLRQALDLTPDASEQTVLARICKLRQEPQPERMTEALDAAYHEVNRLRLVMCEIRGGSWNREEVNEILDTALAVPDPNSPEADAVRDDGPPAREPITDSQARQLELLHALTRALPRAAIFPAGRLTGEEIAQARNDGRYVTADDGGSFALVFNTSIDRPQRQGPPQPERMTEAERALCDYAACFEPKLFPYDMKDPRIVDKACELFNAVRDERRQQTKGATEPDARLPGSMRAPGTAETSVAPKEPCAYNCDSWEGGECTCGIARGQLCTVECPKRLRSDDPRRAKGGSDVG